MIGELKVKVQVPTWERQNHCILSSAIYNVAVVISSLNIIPRPLSAFFAEKISESGDKASDHMHLFNKLWDCEGSSVDISVIVSKLKHLHFLLCQCSCWLTQHQFLNNSDSHLNQ